MVRNKSIERGLRGIAAQKRFSKQMLNPKTGKILETSRICLSIRKPARWNLLCWGRAESSGSEKIASPFHGQAATLQQNGTLQINQEKAKLKSAPVLKRAYSNLNQPDYIVTVYEFYAVPMDAGGAESPGGIQHNRGSRDTNSNATPKP